MFGLGLYLVQHNGRERVMSDVYEAADVFSRGGLTLTCDLIRGVDPALALAVRNIAGGAALAKDVAAADNKHSDYFRVTLDSFQVRAVVEALMMAAIDGADESSSNPGNAVIVQALTEDWIKLARWMVAALPADQRPV